MADGAQYREWRPAPALRRLVACTWAGRLGEDGAAYTDAVLPDGCIDLVWDGSRLFVAGPDTGPVPITRRPGGFFVGLRFRPGAAPGFLGVAAADLLDRRVDAADVLGHRAGFLAERLDGADGLSGAAGLLESELLAWLPRAPAPDRLLHTVVAALDDPWDATPVASLAARLGLSERQLHRRCIAAVGYGPKTLQRILRFRRFLDIARDGAPDGLAVAAALVGYADQAHLSRETRVLAGATPAALVRPRGAQDAASESFKTRRPAVHRVRP